MSGPGERVTLTREDVIAAQTVIDAWTEDYPYRQEIGVIAEGELLRLRGLMAAAMSDVRYAGWIEGTLHGRKLVAEAVRDALEGEGL